MSRFLIFLLALFLFAQTEGVRAQSTASPVVPGYWTTSPQPNCTGTQCFVQYGPGGQIVVSQPYSFTPLGGAQFNQTATVATTLTVPTGAVFARICAMIGQFNFVDSTNGTPTTGATPTVGTPLAAGSCVFEQGAALLAAFQLINAVASNGAWTATYFK